MFFFNYGVFTRYHSSTFKAHFLPSASEDCFKVMLYIDVLFGKGQALLYPSGNLFRLFLRANHLFYGGFLGN